MQIIKQTILKSNKDSNIKINIGSNDQFLGYQQEIDNYTKFKSTDLVNPVIDGETRRFKISPRSQYCVFKFSFNNLNSFIGAGFTQNEIDVKSSNFCNSFFILDFYDTYNTNKQNRIFRQYLTKLDEQPIYYTGEYPSIGLSMNQFYYWHIPESFIKSQSGSTVIGYVKFSFYNAKSGTTSVFYNEINSSAPVGLTPEKLFFKVRLNVVNRTWDILNLVNNIADAKELNINSNYIRRVNNTYSKQNTVKQTYPSGVTFNTNSATYEIV